MKVLSSIASFWLLFGNAHGVRFDGSGDITSLYDIRPVLPTGLNADKVSGDIDVYEISPGTGEPWLEGYFYFEYHDDLFANIDPQTGPFFWFDFYDYDCVSPLMIWNPNDGIPYPADAECSENPSMMACSASNLPVAVHGGSIGVVMFNIDGDLRDEAVWSQPAGSDTDASIRFCAKLSVMVPIANSVQTISFLETKFESTVTFTGTFEDFGTFENFEVQVEQGETQMERTKTSGVNVPVTAFLCDQDNNEFPAGLTFSQGQEFRVCVVPNDATYETSSFTSVSCVKDGVTRILIDADGNPDILTTVYPTVIRRSLAFSSFVTTEWLDSGGPVTCQGSAGIDSVPLTRRRALEETAAAATATVPTADPFEFNINLTSAGAGGSVALGLTALVALLGAALVW